MRLIIIIVTCLGLVNGLAQTRKMDYTNCSMGFVNSAGEVLVPFEYDYLPQQYDILLLARKGKKLGLIRGDGSVFLPFEYTQIQRLGSWILVTNERGIRPKWGLLDAKGQQLLPPEYEEIGLVDTSWIWGRKSDRTVQLLDKNGQVLFTGPRSDGPTQLQPGFDRQSVFIRRQQSTVPPSWVDLQGQPLNPPGLEEAIWSNGKQVIVKRERKYGLVDLTGKVLLPVEYFSMQPLPNGHFSVEDARWQKGVVNAEGQFLMKEKQSIVCLGDQPGDYYSPTVPNPGLGVFDPRGKRWHEGCQALPLINPTWDYLPECQYQRYSWLWNHKNEQHGLMRADGKLILPVRYLKIDYASERHPILAYQREANNGWSAMAYDLEGNSLWKSPFFRLDFTESPCLLFGQKTADGPWGFIPMDQPESAELLYDSMKVEKNRGILAYKGAEQFRFSLAGEPVKQTAAPSSAEPSFPGGDRALMNYIAKHLKYPEEARKQGIEGIVVLQFTVEEDGRLTEISLRKDLGGGCGEEAIRLLKNMPPWVPAAAQGKPVRRTKMTLPVKFKLN